jgi:hypothetical protein
MTKYGRSLFRDVVDWSLAAAVAGRGWSLWSIDAGCSLSLRNSTIPPAYDPSLLLCLWVGLFPIPSHSRARGRMAISGKYASLLSMDRMVEDDDDDDEDKEDPPARRKVEEVVVVVVVMRFLVD